MKNMFAGSVRIITPSKLPTNYFMGWLREEIRAGHICINFLYHTEKYVSDMIDENEAQSWNPNTPVVISTQTGSGKNTFMREKLLRWLVESNYRNDESERMLILSNRIALNRQNKMKFAESMRVIAGNASVGEEIEHSLTEEGLDKKTRFGLVDIYSYHQFHQAKPLRHNKYKYIVCDECHFFTSDALFNPETNEMLREIISKGEDSIRIYMSATPDVAFEAILRQEYERIKVQVNNLWKANERFKASPDLAIARVNALARHVDNAIAFYSDQQIDTRCKNEISNNIYPLSVFFYYGERNYDYINKIFNYEKIEDLAEEINKSDKKWLVFVLSQKVGNQLVDALKRTAKNTDSTETDSTVPSYPFLSRPRLDSNKAERDVYDTLIKNERFDTKVLISTSLLDNGININDEDVENIVIDMFDRTEFIQMLGRIRIRENSKVNLYIKKYTAKELQRFHKKANQYLIQRLENDFLSVPDRKNHFQKNLFFYTDIPETFCDYNPCAIYQLVDSNNRILHLLKNMGESFIDDSESANRTKVYDYYKLNSASDNKSWSRSIVDCLESSNGEAWRDNQRKEDMKYGEFNDRYSYHFHDTFTRYIFSDLIPDYYNTKIEQQSEKELNAKLDTLNDSEKNQFAHYFRHRENDTTDVSSNYRKLMMLSDFMDTYDIGLPPNLDKLKQMKERVEASLQLAENYKTKGSVEEQLCWIERMGTSTTPVNAISMNDDTQNDVSLLHEWIKSKAITEIELDNSRKKGDGTLAKYYNRTFLEEHGILKDSNNENKFSQLLFGKDTLNVCLQQSIVIDGLTFTLKSYRANGENHNTFYVFLKTDIQGQSE